MRGFQLVHLTTWLLACLLWGSAVIRSEQSSLSTLLAAAKEQEPRLIDLRRQLHQWPELLFDVHNTSAFIMRELDTLHIPYE